MDIRPVSDGDSDALQVLARVSHGAEAAPVTPVRQESRTFVADQGSEVVGFVIATLTDYGLSRTGMIEELAIRQEYQGSGLGAALVAQCERWLAEEGMEVVFVSALAEADGFYRRIGFKPCTGPWLFRVLQANGAGSA
jgi:predicted N-acetyltransferase YhbS